MVDCQGDGFLLDVKDWNRLFIRSSLKVSLTFSYISLSYRKAVCCIAKKQRLRPGFLDLNSVTHTLCCVTLGKTLYFFFLICKIGMVTPVPISWKLSCLIPWLFKIFLNFFFLVRNELIHAECIEQYLAQGL